MRWPIEACFAEGKGELGLDHDELRLLRLLAYQRTRKAAAYRSHRKRTLTLLNQRRE